LMEAGVKTPWIFSADECRKYWKARSTESVDGNNPRQYARKDRRIGDFLAHIIRPYLSPGDPILELGSNCGVNLDCLRENGFHNLHDIEICASAIELMRSAFPKLSCTVINGSVEEVLPRLKSASYKLVFSMGVAMHIHPNSRFVFRDISRISSQYVFAIETEVANNCYVFARNYRRVYESLGFVQRTSILLDERTQPPVGPDYYGCCARLLEKR
jgi:methyltransferase family protein